MATVILLRHGRTSANASGTLAGRTPGVHLDDLGPDAGRSGRRPARRRAARGAGQQPARAVPRDRPGVATRQAARPPGPRRQGADRVRLRRVAGPAAARAGQAGAVEDGADQPVGGDVPRRRVAAADAGARGRRRTPSRRRGHGGARCRRGLAGGQPRRRDQVRARRRPRHAPRPVPADPGRPGVDLGDPLHRGPALRAGLQHPRGRPLVAGPKPGKGRAAAAGDRGAAVGGGAAAPGPLRPAA